DSFKFSGISKLRYNQGLFSFQWIGENYIPEPPLLVSNKEGAGAGATGAGAGADAGFATLATFFFTLFTFFTTFFLAEDAAFLALEADFLTAFFTFFAAFLAFLTTFFAAFFTDFFAAFTFFLAAFFTFFLAIAIYLCLTPEKLSILYDTLLHEHKKFLSSSASTSSVVAAFIRSAVASFAFLAAAFPSSLGQLNAHL